MPIVWQAIDQPNPDPTDLRRQSRKQICHIMHSIRDFASNVSTLIDRNGNVIAVTTGSPRIRARLEYGATLYLDHLTPVCTG